MAHLVVIAGPDAGQVVALPAGEPQLIGRSSEAIRSTDRSVSRRHAELTPELDGGWSIRDLASRHGTMVQGRRLLASVRLLAGNLIRCGTTEYLYKEAEASPGIAPVEPAPADAVPALAHSIKNILQGLRGGTDTIQMALDRGDLDLARRGWPLVSRNLDRIYALSLNLLALARPRTLDLVGVSLGEVVRDAVALARGSADARGVSLAVVVEQAPQDVWADQSSIHHAVLNLLLNAIEAAPAKTGSVRIVVGVWGGHDDSPPATPRAFIAVEDNGGGVDPSIAPLLFRPFASTKGQRGSGLGLAVTQHIAQAHGGDVEWDRDHTDGARFVLWLPTGRPESDPDETSGPEALDPGVVDEKFR
ncbi:MAG: ATP-binding protein [Planctomycetota bacterium]|nr:ATP-binding protein [Planctomycetota bacterium]